MTLLNSTFQIFSYEEKLHVSVYLLKKKLVLSYITVEKIKKTYRDRTFGTPGTSRSRGKLQMNVRAIVAARNKSQLKVHSIIIVQQFPVISNFYAFSIEISLSISRENR